MASSAREMFDRQELDDGAADDTVHISTGHGLGGTGGRHEARTYHEDAECFQLTKTGRESEEKTREEAQRKWLGPCKDCVLDGGEP